MVSSGNGVMVGVLALVVDFREIIMTSPSELAHCAPSQRASRPKLRISTKKYFFSETILYISIVGLKMAPMAQKPAFWTYLMVFFLKNIYENS